LIDYRDFLRTKRLMEWPREHPYSRRLDDLIRVRPTKYETFKKGVEHEDPSISANVIMGVIKVTNYLLDKQLKRLEFEFVREGGLRERMTAARIAFRKRSTTSTSSTSSSIHATTSHPRCHERSRP
jgi:four helix bundle suffix protein